MDLTWEMEQPYFEKSLPPAGVGDNNNIEAVGETYVDDKDYQISLKGADLQSGKPYIEIIWKNLSDSDKSINPYEFEILYSQKRNEFGIESYKTCAVKELYIPYPALIIPANDEVAVKYSLEDYDLSQNAGQYCFMSRIAEFENGDKWYAKLFFTLS